MTTIPNLNIVIQQGGAAREVHNIRSQPFDSAQAAASMQPDRELVKREQVQESDENELARFSQEKGGHPGGSGTDGGRRETAEDAPAKPRPGPEEVGHLLDTRA